MNIKTLFLFGLQCLFFIGLGMDSISQNLLQSGPMLGYNEMREVAVWLQTKEAADVYLEYWAEGDASKILKTNTVSTEKQNAFTAHLICDGLEPGTKYQYRIIANGHEFIQNQPLEFKTQELWQWRRDAPEFKFTFGSCTYINEAAYDRPDTTGAYGGDYSIFESIADEEADLMLWLGDNVYLREVDWNSRSGFLSRYTHTRSIPEMQRLLATSHNYAIWDDHDYGPNDATSCFIHKDFSLEAFQLFWANNGYGLGGKPSITGMFQYNDIDFFLLDNRSFRTANNLKGDKKTVLGGKQIDWLIQALLASNSHFKVVALGGQLISYVDKFENYAQYEDERLEILERIEQNNIEGVIFLTGDRHSGELSTITLENGSILYDMTSSPLTSRAYDHSHENNKSRVEDSAYGERNYGSIEVKGTMAERYLILNLKSVDGKTIWTHRINHDYTMD